MKLFLLFVLAVIFLNSYRYALERAERAEGMIS